MSPPAWTPAKLIPDRQNLPRRVWRIVEKAKIRQSAVDEFGNQRDYFHHLLCDPFRPCMYEGSRFRRAGVTPGVWYGAETPETAAIEMAFHRSLRYLKSGVGFPSGTGEHIAFSVEVKAEVMYDLTTGAVAQDNKLWDLVDYAPCQDLGEELCKRKCEIIRYASVRDKGGINFAVLSCCAFVSHEPLQLQTWNIQHKSSGVHIACEEEGIALRFLRLPSGDVDWRNPMEK